MTKIGPVLFVRDHDIVRVNPQVVCPKVKTHVSKHPKDKKHTTTKP